MTLLGDELPDQKWARTAGFLYLLIILCGITAEVVVRSALVIQGDPMASMENIQNSTGLYYLGFVLDVVMLLCDVAIAVLFYHLLKHVSKTLALMAAAFRLTQAAVLGVNLLNFYTPILLLSYATFDVFNTEQVANLMSLFLQMHSYGYDLGLMFFAVSNLVLGYLLIRSAHFPSALGYLVQVAAIVYLVGSLVHFLWPSALALVQPAYVIPLVAELAFCLYLLIKGVKVEAG